jgi:3-hydroxyisobutyrate dehydrogenase-like beta-hydroxyacid dehydrogenase
MFADCLAQQSVQSGVGGGRDLKPKIGFVGLGNIGAPLCRHLLERGYDLWVYDVRPQAMEKFGQTSAQLVSSLAELAAAVDVVILSLPDSATVEDAIFAENGLAEGLSAGKVLIDTSSSQPSSTRRIAEYLSERGIYMLDAPVSGGVLRAEQGTLAIIAGGEREIFDRHFEILRSFGEQVFYVGDHGNGHLAKALNNLLSATTLASAAEVVLLGARAGLDPEKLIEVVNASSGRSNSTEVKFPRYILNRAFDDGFAIKLMSKDLKIALETASELEFPTLIGSVIGQVWQAAVAQGFGLESHTAIYAFLESLTEQQKVEDTTP